MTSWESDLDKFTVKLTDAVPRTILPAFAAALHESIAVGSPITGSPGQPVGQYGPGYHEGEVGGTLRGSWIVEFPTADTARVITKSEWAEQNEDGIARPGGGPYMQRSSVGGRFSVALTLTGAQRLLDHVAKEAA